MHAYPRNLEEATFHLEGFLQSLLYAHTHAALMSQCCPRPPFRVLAHTHAAFEEATHALPLPPFPHVPTCRPSLTPPFRTRLPSPRSFEEVTLDHEDYLRSNFQTLARILADASSHQADETVVCKAAWRWGTAELEHMQFLPEILKVRGVGRGGETGGWAREAGRGRGVS